ncbi:MAG TPA: hypothetical protein VJ672_16300 [Gemmatimonadaceae bacterium]|nr:hypothetical protein [Gemmatimonadaceae bacterium]
MTAHPRQRSGFALALAIATICIIGTLITGILFASTQEYRLGRNALLQTRALTAAELGLHAVAMPRPAGNWTPTLFSSLPIGHTTPPLEFLPGDGAVDTVRITRLNELDFLVVSEGRAGTEQEARARRRLSSILTLRIPRLGTLAALTIRGPVSISDSATIDGSDTTFTGASCLTTGPSPGILSDDSSQVNASACATGACMLGAPPLATSPAAADTTTYLSFGDADWYDLVGQADKIVTGAAVGGMSPSFDASGACDTSDPSNWGDASRAAVNGSCQAYYPIIYAPGDLHITSGGGQGVLLVDGDLEVSGGAEFVGAVIVRGRLSSGGAGGRLAGAVLVANRGGSTNTLGGLTSIRRSSCAVAAALVGSARPSGVRRVWNELF